MKKLLCAIMSAIILSTTVFAVSAADVSASVSATPDEAQEQTTEGYCDGFYYNVLDDGTAEITEYEGDETDLIIPDYLDGYKVTVIDCAFRYGAAEKLHSVTIGKNIKTIYGGRSLYGCKNAENIFVNPENDRYYDINGVLYDRTYSQLVFYPPARTGDYHIVDGTCSISGGAFSETQLTNLYFPDSVSYFEGAFLTMTYETETFQNTRLENVFVSENNPYLYSDNGVLYSKDSFSGAIDCLVFYPPKNKTINLEIKDGVKGIDPFIQANNLKSISIPKSVTAIGYNYNGQPFQNIFNSCVCLENITVDSENPVFSSQNGVLYDKTYTKLLYYPKAKKDSSFLFPDSIEETYELSFSGNQFIKNIVLSKSCRTIQFCAFSECSNLENVYFNDGLNEIENFAFANCVSLKEVQLPDSVTTLGYAPFQGCDSLTKANIPKGVERVEYNLYCDLKSLTDITISEGVKSISEGFWGCDSLKNIVLPDSLEHLHHSFNDCTNLESVTFGDNLITVGGFYNCDSLTEINLPDSVKSVDEHAFYNCDNLKTITLGKGVSELGENFVDKYSSNLENIFVNKGNEHYVDDNGILFSLDSGVLLVYPRANKSTALTVPDGITTLPDIENHALAEINIPASVTQIGNINERVLENINVSPDNPHFYSISGVLFSKGTNEMLCYPPKNETTELTIPDGVVTVCNIESSYLKTLNIPSSVTEIGNISCNALENINVSADNQTYCSIDGVLYNKSITEMLCFPLASKITDYHIPNSVAELKGYFENAKHLKNIYVPQSVTEFGHYTFTIHGDCIENIYVENGNLNYYSENGILYYKSNGFVAAYPENNKTTDFHIPERVTYAYSWYFLRDCHYVENVYVPQTAKFNYSTMQYCDNLKNVFVDENNSLYCDIDGVMYSKDKTKLLLYPRGRNPSSISFPLMAFHISRNVIVRLRTASPSSRTPVSFQYP